MGYIYIYIHIYLYWLCFVHKPLNRYIYIWAVYAQYKLCIHIYGCYIYVFRLYLAVIMHFLICIYYFGHVSRSCLA